MIHLIRPKEVPEYLQEKNIQPYFKQMEDFYSRPVKTRLQERFKFSSSLVSRARANLREIFNEKCAYCEEKLLKEDGTFDSFRPRRLAKNLNAEVSDDHYWWLYTEWKNMYYVCRKCNMLKGTWFPVQGRRCKLRAPYNEVIKEKSLLIDPCIDQPHLHIGFSPDGKLVPKTEQGKITRDLLKLNRADLVNKRARAMVAFNKYIQIISTLGSKSVHGTTRQEMNEALEYVRDALSDNPVIPFCGAYRSLIISAWEHNPVFKDAVRTYLADKKFKSSFYNILRQKLVEDIMASSPKTIVSKKGTAILKRSRQTVSHATTKVQFIIEKIEISNFRMIQGLTIEFPSISKQDNNSKTERMQEPWLVLLGENGVGKSSILQAIALVLMGRNYLKRLQPQIDDFLKHGAEAGYVKVYEVGEDTPYTLEFSRLTGKIKSSVIKPLVNLLGYGSTRLFPTIQHKPEQSKGMVRVMNLFDPHVPLTDAQKWLVHQFKLGQKNKAHSKQFDRIALAIKDLLILCEDDRIVVERGRVFIHQKGNRIPITVMSEGYKSILSVVADIMYTINKVNTSMETAQGIVLLDEIGTHLHPRWRMQVVNRFRKVFPKMQFVVTTHDPLCLRGLQKGEVIVLRKTPEERIYKLTDLPDPAGLNAEQLLGSEFFGLSSTYEPEDEEKLNEYHFLLIKTTLTKAEEKRKQQLETFVKKKNKIGDNLYEQALHEVVQQKVAETKFQTPETKIELNKSTIDKIKSIWEAVES